MPASSLSQVRRRCLALVALLGVMALPALAPLARAQPTPGADAAWAALSPNGIVLFRHAEAPGISDPPNMRLDDCETQRNLSNAGRAQAQAMGDQFRARGIYPAVVLSSQWCRTRETARLAFPGQARDEPAFNSFFGNRERRAEQTEAARALLRRWRGPGVLVVVTHQVNITALTGEGVASGEGVVVRVHPRGGGKGRGAGVEVLARLPPL
jgi:phosphohistidine phosphatase SixA